MKKVYINPEMHIVKIETLQMLAGSLDPENNKGTVTESFVPEETPAESRGRGFWDDEDY